MPTAQKFKFSIMNFFSRCKQGTAKLFTFTEEILHGKLYIFCRVATIYIPAKLIIIAKFLALGIYLFEMLEIWWLINNMKSLYYILFFNLAWIKSSFTWGQSSRRNPENTTATWPDGEKSNEVNPLSANFTKWSNTLKQVAGKLPTNCLSVFDHFVGLALKGLNS